MDFESNPMLDKIVQTASIGPLEIGSSFGEVLSYLKKPATKNMSVSVIDDAPCSILVCAGNIEIVLLAEGDLVTIRQIKLDLWLPSNDKICFRQSLHIGDFHINEFGFYRPGIPLQDVIEHLEVSHTQFERIQRYNTIEDLSIELRLGRVYLTFEALTQDHGLAAIYIR